MRRLYRSVPPILQGVPEQGRANPWLIGLVLAIVWAAPSQANDCTDARDFEAARVARAYDTKLSELSSYAAANSDHGGLKLAAIERRLGLLRKAALKRIGKATRVCARDRRPERISRVANLYVSKKLQAAIPARLALTEPERASPAPALPSRSSIAPTDRIRQVEVPIVPVLAPPQVADPVDFGATVAKPAPIVPPVPQPPVAKIVREKAAVVMAPITRKPANKSAAEEAPVNEALKALVGGDIAFDRPKKVRVDNAIPVHAKLSTIFPAGVPMRAPDDNAQGRIGATLSGGNGLSISPAVSQTQWVNRHDPTIWRWEVTPKDVGRQTVTLSLDAITTIDGKDKVRHLRTVTHQFDVDVAAPAFSLGEWVKSLEMRFGNISWLWASILVPIGLVLLRWRRRASDAAAK